MEFSVLGGEGEESAQICAAPNRGVRGEREKEGKVEDEGGSGG